eukprot:TRINITY_DN11411_c0_g1_i1.p1 TRINITY_DN11411_c0_g1~~TRINITY_DN11411_c0_g1_i1.p1  ORF type:complete len:364 (-),score=78.22 TRINITY_DN11411_c0_g1_i1:114-1205(-)
MTTPTTSQVKPVAVLVDPQWQFAPDARDELMFLKEAKVDEECVKVLRGRFERYSSEVKELTSPNSMGLQQQQRFMTPRDFSRLNLAYKVCKPEEENLIFKCFDRRGAQMLSFQDFLMGAAAASPMTPHILNSHTGRIRAEYIFNFYDRNGSGFLDFEDLAQLLSDAAKQAEDEDELRDHARRISCDLGEVDAITLCVFGLAGHIADVRVSTRWSFERIQREIARTVEVGSASIDTPLGPVESQKLVIANKVMCKDDILTNFIVPGTQMIDVTLIQLTSDANGEPFAPVKCTAMISDAVNGAERLAHVNFDNFYKAFVREKIRGTSRLFRFHRSVLHTRSAGSKKDATATNGAALRRASALGGA